MSKNKKALSKDEGGETITAYKGFDKDFSCRGFKYEVGKTYKHEGEVKACSSGFHSCEYPLDVFSHYMPAESRFGEVKASGKLSRDVADSKIASEGISIIGEISVAGLVKAAIKYTRLRCKPANHEQPSSTTDNRSASQATGFCSASQATVYRGASQATGTGSVAVATGTEGRAMAGEDGAIALCYRDETDGRLSHIRASKVGENGIKPSVWYMLDKNGEFVEVES